MPEAPRCWVCHRSVEEITAAVDTETAEERELKKQISLASSTKMKFTESADIWRKTLPRDFKDMDFQFIAANAAQFGTIKMLAEVLEAKKSMVDWLADTSSRLRDDGETKDLPELSSIEKLEVDSLVRMLDQFELKSRRTIQDDAHKEGYATGFEGLKLFEGLEFLIAQGLLYYDVRAQLLTFALARASKKKPRKSLRMVQSNGYPPVQLCSVCEGLIAGLRAPERRAEEQVVTTEAVPKPAKREEKVPENMPPAETVVAPVVVAEGVSPSVAEIMNKLGPATKEPPKTRSLHEHRATEEWDEVLKQQQAKEK